MNYLGHWLLTHQLLAGQQHLRKSQATVNNRSQPAKAKQQLQSSLARQQSQTSALNRRKRDLDMHHITVVAGSSQQTQQSLGSDKDQGTRVVMLSSMTHSAGRIRFDDLHAKRSYNGFNRYADSKLAIMLGVQEFAKHMDRHAPQTNRQMCKAASSIMLVHCLHSRSNALAVLLHVYCMDALQYSQLSCL